MGYAKTRVAVDAVLFTILHDRLHVYLLPREKEPDKGKLSLPGGLLHEEESAEDTIKRKLSKILGVTDIYVQQFFTFTQPERDPRERAVSIGYIALIAPTKISTKEHWHPITIKDLAFDHHNIILRAQQFLKEHVNELIVRQFLPKNFPLNQLQRAYEIIEQQSYDNRNFRKRIIQQGIVKLTDKREENVSHRPAQLYTF